MNRIVAVIAVLSLAIVGTSTTFAGTINVPGDQPTIAAAISASVDGDVIDIAAGTYNEANLYTDGKAITIQGTLNGDGTLATTIDAQQGGSVFKINCQEDSATVIQNLIITGGSANAYGGGIFCEANSNPTISGCTITGNRAGFQGGGIYCNSTISGPTISGCTISGNEAGYGGGIYFSFASNPTISGCTISNNTANASGGGIYCVESNPTISDCTMSDNVPSMIYGPATLIPNTISTTGACCVSSGCVALTSDDCMALGGTWLGEGGSCDDCPASCSGDTNNDGVINIEDLLNMLSNFGSVCP